MTSSCCATNAELDGFPFDALEAGEALRGLVVTKTPRGLRQGLLAASRRIRARCGDGWRPTPLVLFTTLGFGSG